MTASYPRARIQFEHYRIKRLEFTLLDIDNDALDESVKLEFGLRQAFAISDDSSEVRVTLACEVFPEKEDSARPFHLMIEIEGFFSIGGPEGDSEELQLLIARNTIAILFPYLRSAVSNITSTANVPPLILPTINVADWLRGKPKRQVKRRIVSNSPQQLEP